MSQIQVRCALHINRHWFNFDGGIAIACMYMFLPISHERDRPDTLARWFPIRPRTCLHICLHVAYALHSIVLANCSFNLFIIGNIRLAACPVLLNIIQEFWRWCYMNRSSDTIVVVVWFVIRCSLWAINTINLLTRNTFHILPTSHNRSLLCLYTLLSSVLRKFHFLPYRYLDMYSSILFWCSIVLSKCI